jgi:cobalt-zinc-cadmium efflux system membrane fusion protein
MTREYRIRAGLTMLTLSVLLAACSRSATDSDHSALEANGKANVETEQKREAGESEHAVSDSDFARIDPSRAPSLGIEIAQATGGSIAETVTLTGRLIIDPMRVAAVRARFAGPVVHLYKDIGESIRAGEPLADVESNESLTIYAVRSPLSGVVLERHTNVGDVAGDQPMFRVGDVTRLQAELKVFPAQRAAVNVGAAAHVQLGSVDASGRVIAIAPEVDGPTQAVNVRIALAPSAGVSLVPGQFVTALIEHGRGDAAVIVPSDAVQRLADRDVVFVPEAQGFRARPVTVGRRGAQRLEIRDGLTPGTPYVAKGAFLLKAEIGKNQAADQD